MTPKILELLAKNKGKGFFKAENTQTDTATVYLYDTIVSDSFWGGIDPKTFAKELNAITAPTIKLRIQSPGGDIFAARAMSQAIAEHTSKIVAYVDGMAASAATFPVIASAESYISDGGMFMIHNAWTIAMGNSLDFAEMADLLGRTDATLASAYAKKTGKPADEMKALMDATTYFYGQEAVDAGFVDQINTTNNQQNKIGFDLSAYQDQAENQAEKETLQHNENRLRLMQALLTH